jgi:4-amino-4-deoxy-L-arabinose transferase-like glycosyltransferase
MFDRLPGRVVLAAALLATIVIGAVAAYRYEVWSPIDEASHFDYVRTVAEEHRLPRLDDPTSDQVLSIRDGVYPEAPVTPREDLGIASTVYEAFQPPAYYVIAAPAFRLVGDYRTKVTVLRLFGLALYAGSLLLFAQLCRDVAKDRWKEAFAFGALFFLLPGNVIRAVTVGNEALDVPLGILTVWLLWRALKREHPYRYLGAAALAVGLGVLTKFTFLAFLPVLLVVAAILWRREGFAPRRLPVFALAGLTPVLMLAPWLLWNHRTYGTWTANSQAKAMQAYLINPTHADYGLSRVIDGTAGALDSAVPQGWHLVATQPFPSAIRWFLLAVLFMVPAVFLATRPRLIRGIPGASVLVLPLVLTYGLIAYITIVQDWDSMIFRYLRPALPGWFLFAFFVWDGSVRDRAVPRSVAMTALGGLAILWWANARHYLGV